MTPTMRILSAVQDWLVLRARTVAAVLLGILAGVQLRNGISGLT